MELQRRRRLAAEIQSDQPTVKEINLQRRDKAFGALKPALFKLAKAMNLDTRKKAVVLSLTEGLTLSVEHLLDTVRRGMNRPTFKAVVGQALRKGLFYAENKVRTHALRSEGASQKIFDDLGVQPLMDVLAIQVTEALQSPGRKIFTWTS